MDRSGKEPDTLETAQILSKEELDYFSSLDDDSMSRMMTPEDWEKYGSVNIRYSR